MPKPTSGGETVRTFRTARNAVADKYDGPYVLTQGSEAVRREDRAAHPSAARSNSDAEAVPVKLDNAAIQARERTVNLQAQRIQHCYVKQAQKQFLVPSFSCSLL